MISGAINGLSKAEEVLGKLILTLAFDITEKKAVLIMDDSKGIEVARMLNIKVEPTLTVVFIAYALGISGYSRAKNIYKTLLTTAFRISALEYEKALRHLDRLREIMGLWGSYAACNKH